MDSYHDGFYSDGDEGAAVLAEYVGVMDELKSLILEENNLLGRGLPASSLTSRERTEELSEAFAFLNDGLLDDLGTQPISDPDVARKLREAGARLEHLSSENASLLNGALAATQRRILAVIEAALGADRSGGPSLATRRLTRE